MTQFFFNYLTRKTFQNDEEWHLVYFIVIALLVAELFKISIYANSMTCDVTVWTQSDVK